MIMKKKGERRNKEWEKEVQNIKKKEMVKGKETLIENEQTVVIKEVKRNQI